MPCPTQYRGFFGPRTILHKHFGNSNNKSKKNTSFPEFLVTWLSCSPRGAYASIPPARHVAQPSDQSNPFRFSAFYLSVALNLLSMLSCSWKQMLFRRLLTCVSVVFKLFCITYRLVKQIIIPPLKPLRTTVCGICSAGFKAHHHGTVVSWFFIHTYKNSFFSRIACTAC